MKMLVGLTGLEKFAWSSFISHGGGRRRRRREGCLSGPLAKKDWLSLLSPSLWRMGWKREEESFKISLFDVT